MNKLSFNPLKAMIVGLLLIAASLSVNGQFTFQKRYDRSAQSISGIWHNFKLEETRAIAQNQYSPNDYFIAGGYVSAPNNDFPTHCGIIYKLNLRGELQWEKEFYRHGYFNDIKCTYNNNALSGLIVGGGSFPNITNTYEFLLVKTDANGTPLYRMTYAPNSTCEKVEQVITNGVNDGFIAVGKKVENNLNNVLLVVRVKEDLTLYWQYSFDLGSASIDEAYSVKQTSDGGFIITGRASDALIVLKLDASGNITWQNKYEYNNQTLIGNDIIEVQNSSSQPEYFVLGNTSGTTDDNLLILKLDQNGVHQLTALVQITGTNEKAEGIIALPSGEFAISGTSDGQPILLRVLWGVAATFQKKYTNSLGNSTVVATQDNGFIIGGYNNINSNGSPNDGYFYVIKTDANGISDCHETDITASYSAAPITSTILNYTVTSLNNISTDYGGSPLSLNQEVICKDFCKDVIKQTPSSSAHACFGSSITLSVSCPQGTTSTVWYDSTNMDSVINTTSSYVISDAIADATYIVRCINENGCVLKEETITFTVSPAPYSSAETVYACYGQHLSLTSPCGTNETSVWTNPVFTGSTLNIDAFSDDTYVVNCVDQYGCITRTHAFEVVINYVPVTQLHTKTICEGASYDLNLSVVGSGSCVWSTSPTYTPVISSVVSPTTNTTYYAECRDANGCYSYHAVEVTVTPAPTLSDLEELCEGDVLVLDNYFSSGSSNCSWTDMSTGNPVASTGITPSVGTHTYQAVCVDANGCISIYTLTVIVHPLNIIHQTVTVNCGEAFDFEPYSNLCNGITAWAQKVGNDYVMLPFGWAPTGNTIIYGFGTVTDEGCCLLELEIIVNQVTPTEHELCFNGDVYEIPFNCVVGSTKEWTFNGSPVPDGTVYGSGVYEVVCRDENGCVVRRAIFTVVEDPECDQQILCVEEASELTPPCPPETDDIICEKNGVSYPVAGGSVTPNGVGTYVIKCLDADGNVIATHHFLVHNCDENEADFVMGTNKVNLVNKAIKVYPNPSNTGKFFLNVDTKTDDVCSVRIFDGQGKEIVPFRNIAPQSEEIIDLSNRPSGIYHIQLLINNIPYSKIIVVE